MASTTALTAEMSTFYDKVFLHRYQLMTVYDVGADRKAIERNMGKTVSWTRRTPLAVATTPLTEATTPDAVDMTSNSVTAVVAPYGNWTKAGTLYELTSIDQGLREHVEVHAQNAAESVDTQIKAALAGGGIELTVNSKAATAVAASDTFSGVDVRRALRRLKLEKAMPFSNNYFRSVAPVSTIHDLRGSTEWLDAYRYTDATNIRNGLAGRLHGVEFYETNNEQIVANGGAGNVDLYTTFIFGAHAYGTVDIAGESTPRIIVKNPGANDTSNPLDMFSTVGWKMHFATKVLNDKWVIEYKSSSSVGDNA